MDAISVSKRDLCDRMGTRSPNFQTAILKSEVRDEKSQVAGDYPLPALRDSSRLPLGHREPSTRVYLDMVYSDTLYIWHVGVDAT